jgi:hypothetical protein
MSSPARRQGSARQRPLGGGNFISGWAGVDSNHRPTDYESAALTN